MTNKEYKIKIAELEKELKAEQKNGTYTKRACFLMSTIDIYRKEIGLNKKYIW